ncbi:DUF192 domain-containing protein [Methanosphaera sp.]|uniref:DUF192 domain-containing protein n=1 Tax=Methanosphaera sp. TaxID=2666342 RepID=UPI002E79F7EB|nr:DUF192 domain-containing protein [Methanosphaera sp.]MEE1117153.1 DUF192 domain-containing protein [Methanosphaera sp.]
MYTITFINKNTKQKYIIKNISYANTFKKRLLGLMGKTNFDGLMFKQKYENRFYSSIHTCFMKVPIDIIYVNEKNEIQELKKLEPWKIYIPKNGYIKYIIELPENRMKKYELEKGVKVVVEYEK